MDDLQLVALPSAVSCAGLFARFTLTEWSLHSLRDEAERAVREVVTAVVDRADQRSPDFIVVRLRLQDDCVVIEVEGDHPAWQEAGWFESTGIRSGLVPLAGPRKALFWCELPLPSGLTASAVALPRRDSRRSLVTEQMTGEKVEVDPAVLQRILSGLGGTPGP